MPLDSALHIKQTEAFVNENPSSVVIQRRTKTATASGGWKYVAGSSLAAQTVRIVGSVRVGAITTRTTEDGRTVVPTATLIAVPAVDVEPGDLFTADGKDYEVIFVDRDHPPWRVSAEVIEHA